MQTIQDTKKPEIATALSLYFQGNVDHQEDTKISVSFPEHSIQEKDTLRVSIEATIGKFFMMTLTRFDKDYVKALTGMKLKDSFIFANKHTGTIEFISMFE
jgi:hypothetical protein